MRSCVGRRSPIAAASESRSPCSTKSIARRVADRVAQRDAPPRLLEVDRPDRPDLRRDGPDERLEAIGHVVVVGVGLVELDHRELWVVLRRQALVAKVLAELVDALEPADDAALEVELGRDPQVQRAVQRVVVRRERARQRAAVERLQDRRLDLDEAGVVELAADRGDDLRARDEQLARLLVGHQVELAAAVARLDVLQAVVLLGRRAQRLREHGEALDPQRHLAALRAHRGAVDADDVAEVDLRQQALVLLGPEHVRARLQLQPAGAVDEVEEGHLALAAAGGETPGDAVCDVRLLAVLELRVGGAARPPPARRRGTRAGRDRCRRRAACRASRA